MKTWIFAGALALAIMGPCLVKHDTANAVTLEANKLTEVNIAQIKGLLKLTSAQEPLWAKIEEVLISVAREQAQNESGGLLHRISRRVISIAFNDTVTQRLKSAALPLLASLNEDQKMVVRRLASRMGIGHMVAMSN
jgi:hypothetical protein